MGWGEPKAPKMPDVKFVTKDSGERAQFDSGMVRDTQDSKPRYGLIPLGPLKRVAELYARGAEKYAARNWEQANSVDELERFRESAFRHLMQLLASETDEDHGAAVVFNVFAIMWLEERLATESEREAAADWLRQYGMQPGRPATRQTYPCPECAAPEGAYHHRGCTRSVYAP